MINGALSTACRDQSALRDDWRMARFTDEADATFKSAPFEATCPLTRQPNAPAAAVRAQQMRVQIPQPACLAPSAACVRYVT